jgi:hypothetical protein
MSRGPFTRPFTRPESGETFTESREGSETITGTFTGGSRHHGGDPSRVVPSLGDGPRVVRGLSIRVPVDLDTYRRIAEEGRNSGMTLESAASVLLADASTQREPCLEVDPSTSESILSGHLGHEVEGGWGSVTDWVGNSSTSAFMTQRLRHGGTDPSVVRAVEPEVGHE